MSGPLRDVGGLVDRLLGRDGTRWAGSVEDLLFEGERVRGRVPVGDNRVVVTTHRLLAFTPTRDGENYRQVDLPNVADVEAGYDGEDNLLPGALRAAVYGLILLVVGVFVDFGSFVPTDAFQGTGEAAGRIGLGGMFAAMGRLLEIIARLDEVARVVGALVLLFAVFVLAVYVLTRDRAVVVRVAGDAPDVVVPVDEADAQAAVSRLEDVLFGGTAGTDGEARDATAGADTDRGDPVQ
ncbi:MAG: hypothetical protein ABEI80_03115 [Haloplanus sp.]